jgi:hypothetical protein
MLDVFNHAGLFAKIGMLIALGPLAAAILYAAKPSERRLAVLRPLALAALFGGLSSFAAGMMAVLQGMSVTMKAGQPVGWHLVALGTMETFGALLVAFGCLTISWLLVALGLRRTA